MAKKLDNKTALVLTLENEYTKEYCVYDGSNRLSELYQAATDAEDADPCLLTEYSYDGASSRVEKRKESVSAWQVAWDI